MFVGEEGITAVCCAVDDVEAHIQLQPLVGAIQLVRLVDGHLRVLVAMEEQKGRVALGGPVFTVGTRTRLFDWPYRFIAGNGRSYDVSLDSQRFLVISEGGTDEDATQRQFIVVQNWLTELERLVPTQ